MAFYKKSKTAFLAQLAWAVVGIALVCSSAVFADEGMHPISQIGNVDLAAKGLLMDVNDIFNSETTCLVDGICRVNGCTGSFVSKSGLIITNHHCAYRAIQQASTAEQDYLKNGFHAESFEKEIPAPGYVVRVTESFLDVSEKVLAVVNDGMESGDRTKAIERRRKELEKEAEASNKGMRAEVAEMFTGKTYVLFLYTYIKDVRLAFAPPASVGKFGGDVDNWEWPRHTGDFSFMRAYVGPDGSSAEYSPNNVPYRPKRFIQVAAAGANEGDFVMLLGYPGRTARHKTASFLKNEKNIRLPFIVELYGKQIEIMEAAGKNDRSVALKNLSRIQGLANVEKRSRGQLKGLNRAGIIAARQAEERKLQSFIEQSPVHSTSGANLLKDIDAVYNEIAVNYEREMNLSALRGCQMLSVAHSIYESAVEREKDDLDREPAYMDRNFDQTVQRLMISQKNLDVATDKSLLAMLLERTNLDPSKFGTLNLETLYSGTKLNDAAVITSCLKMSRTELDGLDDTFIKLASKLYPEFVQLRENAKARSGKLNKLYGELITIKSEFMQTNFVPDANGTLRLTHGTIRSYSPEDAVVMTPITTLSGVIAKTTGTEPFVTPEKIVKMFENRDFGRYTHPSLNDVPVAILYDTDTTGGNSGSPILNAKGELVGVNFDRAFEATINDFAWNTNYSRSIGVDIRYALWITEKVFGATNLIKEMGL